MKASNVTSAICCVALKEEDYIVEWIAYHLLLGFNAIYIYDNSDDNCLRYFHGAHQGRVCVRHFPGKGQQNSSYNHFLETNKKDFTFAAFIDGDEFIVLKTSRYINPFLESKNIEAGVAINWSMFGSNFRESVGSGGVLQRFVRRSAALDECVKCIVRLDSVDEYSHPHYPTKRRGAIRDAKGRSVKEWSNPDGDDSEIVIFHFWTKSKEEFFRKITRGKATSGDFRPEPFLSFYEFNLRANQVYDDTALRFFESCYAEAVEQGLMPAKRESVPDDSDETTRLNREKQMLDLLVFAAGKIGPLHLWDLQELAAAASIGNHHQEKERLTTIRAQLEKNEELENLLRLERARSEQLQSTVNSLQAEKENSPQKVWPAFNLWKLFWFKRALHKAADIKCLNVNE